MFKIYRCIYKDKKKCIKWEIYGRTVEFTDMLAQRISNACNYTLERVRIGFCKLVYTDWPPYELEVSQVEYVDEMEQIAKNKKLKK